MPGTDTQIMNTGHKISLRVRRVLRVLGIAMALPFFIWLAIGWLPGIPSIVDVFGVTGLKIPAGVVIGGLLLAAIGFEDF